ncbi:peptidase T-like protein [Sphaerochaeta pleomorpha str. Grapes]|uniref:Peptidase T-like protein n=1 Tax=Sphaerochaeta pleomorpha (strain ATCC BAA-1885 / DSM 22778 / Grapes) TaxID=158190 RepID=G8QSS3_SPHPG|nr:M20/M25/M40 family metallo-hydrolase [Sphaerochaeta pleomorpha]AEV30105.1 peptidase T-like protein [Sphaerochaeta pleomorpha str. Grapes]
MNSTVNTFLDLVAINSVSRNEKTIGEDLARRLQRLGIETEKDEAGNLFAFVKGQKETILFNAHMDTVPPAENAKVVIENGIIKTDHTTALGADDKAALAAILSVLERLITQKVEHHSLMILFTTSEEIGLQGASLVAREKLASVSYGYTFDASGPVGTCITAAPGYDRIEATFHGRASHAGFSPETGISAIQMGSEAIASMQLLKIDEETTANVGSFLAPGNNNIVNPKAILTFESRSLDKQKLEKQTGHMVSCLQEAARKRGGTVEITVDHMYGSYTLDTACPAFRYLRETCEALALPYHEQPTLGGSDANVFNTKGLTTVVCCCGYEHAHTVHEEISIEQIDRLEKLVFALATR